MMGEVTEWSERASNVQTNIADDTDARNEFLKIQTKILEKLSSI